jgi:hypothetical protein
MLPRLSSVVLIAIPDREIFNGAEVAAGVADRIEVPEDEAARAAIATTLALVLVSTGAGAGLEAADLLLALGLDPRGNMHPVKRCRGRVI